MSAPTVALTNEEKWARRKLTGGRVSIAVNEILRRLREEVNPYIEYVNDQLELTGDLAIPTFDGFYIAPESLQDSYLNSVLVDVSLEKIPNGTRNHRNRAIVSIYAVSDPITVAEEVSNAWDRCELITHVLDQYLTGCVDLEGRVCWRNLGPQKVEMLPEKWEQYSGVTLTYLLSQDPSDETWKV
jgi:hypothetical protein